MQITHLSRLVVTVALGAALGCGSSSPSPTGPSTGATGVFVIPEQVLIGPGDRQVMAALASFQSGESQEVAASARWESSNPAVVSMDGNEAVGIAPGQAEVRAVLGSVRGTTRVTVFAPNEIGRFTAAVQDRCWPGETARVAAYGALSNGDAFTPTNVIWQSDDPGIATVTTRPTPRGAYSGWEGTLTCHAAGVTRIRASYLGRIETTELTVRVPVDALEERGSASVRNGNTLTYSENVFYVLESASTARIEFTTRRKADPTRIIAASSQTVSRGGAFATLQHSFEWPASQSESELCRTLEMIVAGRPPVRPAQFQQCAGR